VKVGTPGFVGKRLAIAREARGLSMVSLAELVGVSRPAIAQYESGETTPSQDILRQLCRQLDLPLHYFLKPVREVDGVFHYRSMSSATKGARRRAEHRLYWLRELVTYLGQYVKFPALNLLAPNVPTDPRKLTNDSIDMIATGARRHWKLGDGPISDVVLLLENNGIVVSRQDLDSDKLDAFSQWTAGDERPFVVLGSGKASAVRSRFDACHELGHMLLHRNVPAAMLSDPAIFRRVEDQAHRFSSSFLLPATTFSAELSVVTLPALQALKPKWKVSIGMMIRRSLQLGAIDAEAEKRLWINMSRRRWNKREPYDDILVAERPRFLKRCLKLLIEKGLVTRSSLPAEVGLSARLIEQLTDSESGFLSEDIHPELRDDAAAHVLKFPGAQR
jgi:Zn-dependent peptidase ImmA (M78 family)/transcriptional regulator with XRE-family HTH domain